MRRLPPVRVIAVAVLIAVAGMASSASPSPAGAITVEPVIWQLDQDYPGNIGGDAGLSVSTVYIKTHDGSDWMSTYDSNPRAVSGPASIRELIDIYATEGIEVAAWFVPYGTDYDAQVQMAVQVIDSGVTPCLRRPLRASYSSATSLPRTSRASATAERPPRRDLRSGGRGGGGQSATSVAVRGRFLPMCYWKTLTGRSRMTIPPVASQAQRPGDVCPVPRDRICADATGNTTAAASNAPWTRRLSWLDPRQRLEAGTTSPRYGISSVVTHRRRVGCVRTRSQWLPGPGGDAAGDLPGAGWRGVLGSGRRV
jgi:hypothetical protein